MVSWSAVSLELEGEESNGSGYLVVMFGPEGEESASSMRSVVVFEVSGADPVVMASKRLPRSPMKIGCVSGVFSSSLVGGEGGRQGRIDDETCRCRGACLLSAA